MLSGDARIYIASAPLDITSLLSSLLELEDDALIASEDLLLFPSPLASVEVLSTPRGVTGLTISDIPAERSAQGLALYELLLASAVIP